MKKKKSSNQESKLPLKKLEKKRKINPRQVKERKLQREEINEI